MGEKRFLCKLRPLSTSSTTRPLPLLHSQPLRAPPALPGHSHSQHFPAPSSSTWSPHHHTSWCVSVSMFYTYSSCFYISILCYMCLLYSHVVSLLLVPTVFKCFRAAFRILLKGGQNSCFRIPGGGKRYMLYNIIYI